jgi:cytochrome P450
MTTREGNAMPVVWDPVSAESHEDPYPAYERLREEFPLYYLEQHHAWALSRYADVRDALRDWQTFSSAQGVELGEYVQFFGEGSIQELDPPRHDVIRRVLAPRFSSKNIKRYEPIIRECAQELLTELPQPGSVDQWDVAARFTQRLPIMTIFRMLGIPDQDVPWAMEAGLEMLSRPAGESGPSPAAIARRTELVAYIHDQVAQRRAGSRSQQVGDDVLGDMARGIDDDQMRASEVEGLTLLLIAAGMETTASLMGNVVHALATQQVQSVDLLDDSQSFSMVAMDEFLRYDAPGQWLARVTTRSVAIHDQELPEGSRVLVLFASANRDPREFDRPDELILDRDGSRNLSFGEGVHFCIGMPLARLEARVGITELLSREPRFVLDGACQRYPSHVIRGYSNIPVRCA